MDDYIKEAQYYEGCSDGSVKCFLCPHYCEIHNNKLGICNVRKNINGKLMTLNYGKITGYNLDPIEKKPLYHFYPGKKIFSIGSFGCNLKCSFCQNYSIAHEEPQTVDVVPARLGEVLDREESIGVAYTYNEPSIWYEFMSDIARIVKDREKKNVVITNGYINKDPLLQLLPYIDAMNIDLKSFTNNFYRDICKGKKKAVLETIITAKEYCHVEITTLLIEGLNTKQEEIIELSKWIASIDKNIPLHLSRYYPQYKMKIPPTSVQTIIDIYEKARKYLNYVYIGNIAGLDNNTYCPGCKKLIVERGYRCNIENLNNKICNNCGTKIAIIY